QLLANTLELTIDCFWVEEPAATAAEALAVSQKAVQLAPLDYLSNYVLGRALLHSGRHDLAIAAARRSVELNPNSRPSLGGLGGGGSLLGGMRRRRPQSANVDSS